MKSGLSSGSQLLVVVTAEQSQGAVLHLSDLMQLLAFFFFFQLFTEVALDILPSSL